MQLSAGPEIYHFRRVREGGTFQYGQINGIRLVFDRIKRYGWYIGADFLWAEGNLKGKTALGLNFRSELSDEIFEVRAGYTLQQSDKNRAFFTPYAGWGHFKEINHFLPPSPLPLKFTDSFDYIAVGFLSGVNFTPLLSMGVNFKLKFMQDAESHVTNDPVFNEVTLLIKDEMHIRVDIPFTMNSQPSGLGFNFLFSPFFEFRHFGGREGFPFNFRDTKYYLYGARIALGCRF
jgi:hypothetical protein